MQIVDSSHQSQVTEVGVEGKLCDRRTVEAVKVTYRITDWKLGGILLGGGGENRPEWPYGSS